MPLKIGSDSGNEKSGCPCSNHRADEVERDLRRSPSPNHSTTVIFFSTSQVNMYFLSLITTLPVLDHNCKLIVSLPLTPVWAQADSSLLVPHRWLEWCLLWQFNILSSIYSFKTYTLLLTVSFLSLTVLCCSFIVAGETFSHTSYINLFNKVLIMPLYLVTFPSPIMF